EHTDSVGNLRYYEPDFVALAADGIHYIVDTKGLEDTSVANKDRAAQLWCENTTRLAGEPLGLPSVVTHAEIVLPERAHSPDYFRHPISKSMYVPTITDSNERGGA